jgi:hypothetical protein
MSDRAMSHSRRYFPEIESQVYAKEKKLMGVLPRDFAAQILRAGWLCG